MDAALSRLANVGSNPDSVLFSAILTLNNLLMIVHNVRRHVLYDIEKEYITIES